MTNNFFIRIEGVIYTFLFMVVFVISLFIFIFGNTIYNFLITQFYSISIIFSYILKIRFILILLILFVIFIFLYRVCSKEYVGIKKQIPGALFSAFAWYISSLFYSFYAEIFKGFSTMYGSLSSIILIMLWTYTCSYIILLGAEINYILLGKKTK